MDSTDDRVALLQSTNERTLYVVIGLSSLSRCFVSANTSVRIFLESHECATVDVGCVDPDEYVFMEELLTYRCGL